MDDSDPRELEIRALKDSSTDHFHDQDYDLALRDVDRAVQLSEELDGTPRPSLLSRRAYFLRRCGKFDLAEKDVLEAIRLEPNEVKHWLTLSNILVVQKKYDEVVRSAKRVVELDPECAHAYSLRGQALCALKRFSEGLRAHEVAVEKNRGHGALHLQAKSYVEMGLFREALTDISRSLEIREYPIGFEIRANVHIALRNYSLAIPDFSRALEVMKAPKIQAHILWKRTFCLCHEGRLVEANGDLLSSYSHSPEFPGLRSELGRISQIGPDFLRFLPKLRPSGATRALKTILEDELRVESVRFLNEFLRQSLSMIALVMFRGGQLRVWRSFALVVL